MSREKMITLKLAVLAVLWSGVILIVLKFLSEYSGRETATLQAVDVATLDPPSLFMVMDTLTKCEYTLFLCSFINTTTTGTTNCTQAVSKVKYLNSEAYVVDQRKLTHLGVTYKSPTDLLRLTFVLTNRENGTRADVEECTHDISSYPAPRVVLLSDTSAFDALFKNSGQDVNLKKNSGGISLVSHGQSVHYSFSLEQEFLLGEPLVKNKTVFGATQYPFVSKNAIQLLFSPASFTVTQIRHNEGESVFHLMGGMFGWFGVLVGASFYSMFCDVLDLHEKHREAREKEERKKKEKEAENEKEMKPVPSEHVV
eukprot:TRINITY_DN6112_c1_g2_i1.p1 TRINITY_DN6112_c1_g2~~TRINITY_DN6112_c1_g2_i1.p1  ORF type:complete len:312 (+),score=43.48 TRINITY_DN6112_c1_g2_i1:566-1501(+)